MASDVVGRNLDEAETGKTTGDIGFGAVDGDAAAHRNRSRCASFAPLPRLDAPARRRGIVDGPMGGKVMRRFGNTVPLKIGGARNVDQRKLAERSDDQPGIRQWSHAQNAIDTLFDKIDGAISHSQMYIDFRIGIQKLGQGWRDDQTSDAAG